GRLPQLLAAGSPAQLIASLRQGLPRSSAPAMPTRKTRVSRGAAVAGGALDAGWKGNRPGARESETLSLVTGGAAQAGIGQTLCDLAKRDWHDYYTNCLPPLLVYDHI